MKNKKLTVLIADDEKNTRDGLARALSDRYEIILADNGMRAWEFINSEKVDVLLSDVRMPGMDGMALLKRVLARPDAPICILLTAYGTVESAVAAIKLGAYDFLTKPVNLDELEMTLERAVKARDMEHENVRLREQLDEKYGFENIIGNSAAMQDVFSTVRQVAGTRATVLIQGESGTGKELVAHALHQLSPRVKGPFVAVHCAALSTNLLESELFGHEKGAFTGAVEQRRGRFELADGGTLFLDEIGEIDLSVQVKILRVLEQRCFERVGGQRTIEVDVRLISATNRDLRQMVELGKFREDLFYRLDVVVVRMPPLRERREDIPLLAQHFLRKVAQENSRDIAGFTADTLDAMTNYSWPGNVRELRNAVERMVILSRGDKLTVRDLPSIIRDNAGAVAAPKAEKAVGSGEVASAYSLVDTERRMIGEALRASKGVKKAAAEMLGISLRTLHRKLNEYGMR